MNKTEINQKISLFSLNTEKMNYYDSWDLLIPVYQNLVHKAENIENIESSLYLENCIYKKLDFHKMTTQQFALALCSVLDEYYSETEKNYSKHLSD